MKEPKQEDFGWQEPSIDDEGGWMIEGGEEAYFDALDNWKNVKQKELDKALEFLFLSDNEL